MADRAIVVTVRAEAAQFKTSTDQAADSVNKAGGADEATGRQIQSSAAQIDQAGKKVTNPRRQQ